MTLTDNGPPFLRWSVEPGSRTAVLRAAGEIDLAAHHEFDDALQTALNTASAVVVLDLTEISFMGSLGLRALVQARWQAETSERALRIVHGNAPTLRTLRLAGLDQVLTLYETVLDATSD